MFLFIIITCCEFFIPLLADGLSLRVSRTLLRILSDLDNDVVLMLLAYSLISVSFKIPNLTFGDPSKHANY